MAALSTTRGARPQLVSLSPAGITTDGQHKLNRLLELRAVIDKLYYEREARDPQRPHAALRERAKTP